MHTLVFGKIADSWHCLEFLLRNRPIPVRISRFPSGHKVSALPPPLRLLASLAARWAIGPPTGLGNTDGRKQKTCDKNTNRDCFHGRIGVI